ncbi:restriction endonuclease subunit M [Rummeliibacillus suwonensis]|uniref:restriction endonuclease subunit M n=1 Tax=Rummeliibacillus suwonensis TaxID=1306154 RepID=UPI0011B84F85|nr:restriction endonuclease subunit M [Rummeliibacillus suwonensis]
MRRVQDVIELVSGSPQFRIKEVLDDTAPLYTYYGQSEIEDDLVGLDINSVENKQVRTLDKINTVNQGDVLFSLISGKATLVRSIHQGYLFTQNYVKLIPNDDIEPKYLIYLLNEDIGIKRQLQMSLQGSMVLKYTVKQLKELELPKMPSIEKQKLIGELYFNQLRLQALRERAATLETTIVLEKLKEAKSE